MPENETWPYWLLCYCHWVIIAVCFLSCDKKRKLEKKGFVTVTLILLLSAKKTWIWQVLALDSSAEIRFSMWHVGPWYCESDNSYSFSFFSFFSSSFRLGNRNWENLQKHEQKWKKTCRLDCIIAVSHMRRNLSWEISRGILLQS